jgi:hypothetical protein
MDTSDQLPFVVHLDDADDPGDVLDSLALGPFVAGHPPFAQTQQLSRVRPDATFIPAAASTHRLAQGQWRTVVLSEWDGWTLKACRSRDNTATIIVTATDKRLTGRLCSCTGRPAPARPASSGP